MFRYFRLFRHLINLLVEPLPILLLIWFALLPVHAQTLPALPSIPLTNFEAKIQKQLRKIYTEAKAQPQNATANGQLGMVLHAYEQYEIAALCYARAQHFAPQEFRWHYYFGLTQSALAHHTEAVAAFKTTLQLKPDDLPAQLKLADALLAAGQFSEGQPLYEALAKQQASAAQAQYGLGQIKIAGGDTNGGITHFRQALTIFPEYGAAHYALGLALRKLGQISEAQVHLGLSQQYKFGRPAFVDPLLDAIAELNASATDQLTRGVTLASLGKLELAIAAHERALEINPKLVQAHINLISLYARVGQIEKAEQHYRAAIAVNPNLADSYFNYGIVLMGLERYTEAAEAFQRSLERNPFSAESHYNFAIIIEREGRLEEAAIHYRQALANNPEHRQSHFHLARILVQQEKLPEAIEHLLLTLTVEDEDTPRFTYALGATYIRAGEKQKGIPYLRTALQKAKARGQTQMAATIARDLQALEEK